MFVIVVSRGEDRLDRRLLRRRVGLLAALLLSVLPGCLGGSRPAVVMEQYALEYSPSRPTGLPALGQALRVERFSVAQAFNTPAMVYRSAPFKQDVYPYHRWRVNPGDMVSDFIARDLRSSGLFRAVFSYQDTEETRFAVEGAIEEFLEIEAGGGPKASLHLIVTLLDLSTRDVTRRVVFQNHYRHTEPLEERSAAELARGMSRAMENASGAIVRDLHAALQRLAP